jgi:hypothetical protein
MTRATGIGASPRRSTIRRCAEGLQTVKCWHEAMVGPPAARETLP